MTQVSQKSGMMITDESVYQSQIDTDPTLAANSDTKVASQKAVKTLFGTLPPPLGFTPENVANKATNFSTINNTLYPSVKAVNDAITAAVTGLWDDRGNFDASVNAYPSTGGSGTAGAILKGDIWTISVAGTLPTGQAVKIGDTVRALIDTPGNTQANWAIAETNIGYVPENSANKATDLTTNDNTHYPTTAAIVTALANLKKDKFNVTVDGAGITPVAGSKGFTIIPYAGTITGWYVIGDQSGSVQFDLKRNNVSIIGAGNKPILSSAQRANAAASGWTSTAIAVNDEIEFVLDSASTLTRANLIILITKS